MDMQRHQSGFTLIEISIVLVIIGLILGGALKGQELITSAKVRSSINQIDGVKAAYYAFQDRYRALPGDYAQATDNLPPAPPGATAIADGTGNGQITTAAEKGQLWLHMGVAGFLNGDYDGAATTSTFDCVTTTCPANAFSGPLQILFSSQAASSSATSHELITGRRMPVGIVAEIDRKIDDGQPNGGIFRRPDSGTFSACINGDEWNVATNDPRADCVGIIRGL